MSDAPICAETTAPIWISPTIRSRNFMVGPSGADGMEVVTVSAVPCGVAVERYGSTPNVCGLVQGHTGPHWECSTELVEASGGAFAVVVRR